MELIQFLTLNSSKIFYAPFILCLGGVIALLLSAFIKYRAGFVYFLILFISVIVALMADYKVYQFLVRESFWVVSDVQSELIFSLRGVLLIVLLVCGFLLYLNEQYKVRVSSKNSPDNRFAFQGELYALFMFATAGLLHFVVSTNFISLYVGLELASVIGYILVATNRRRASAEAALKYFVLGTISSGIMLMGILILFGFSGATSIPHIAKIMSNGLNSQSSYYLFSCGIIFLLAGLLFKLAVVPFHLWLPDVYQATDIAVLPFVSLMPKIAVSFVVFRLLKNISEILGMFYIKDWLLFLAIVSVFVGALGAIKQKNILRFMAYASIAHIGFILVAATLGGAAGGRAVIFYISIYSMLAIGIFSLVTVLTMQRLGSLTSTDVELSELYSIDMLKGLFKRHRYLAISCLVLIFSMAGMVPLPGFFAKLMVLSVAINNGENLVAVLLVVASLISMFYYLRIIRLMFFSEENEQTGIYEAEINRGSFWILSFMVISIAIFNVIYFLKPDFLLWF